MKIIAVPIPKDGGITKAVWGFEIF